LFKFHRAIFLHGVAVSGLALVCAIAPVVADAAPSAIASKEYVDDGLRKAVGFLREYADSAIENPTAGHVVTISAEGRPMGNVRQVISGSGAYDDGRAIGNLSTGNIPTIGLAYEIAYVAADEVAEDRQLVFTGTNNNVAMVECDANSQNCRAIDGNRAMADAVANNDDLISGRAVVSYIGGLGLATEDNLNTRQQVFPLAGTAANNVVMVECDGDGICRGVGSGRAMTDTLANDQSLVSGQAVTAYVATQLADVSREGHTHSQYVLNQLVGAQSANDSITGANDGSGNQYSGVAGLRDGVVARRQLPYAGGEAAWGSPNLDGIAPVISGFVPNQYLETGQTATTVAIGNDVRFNSIAATEQDIVTGRVAIWFR